MFEFENEDTGEVTPIHCRLERDHEPHAIYGSDGTDHSPDTTRAKAYTSKADFLSGTPVSFASTRGSSMNSAQTYPPTRL
jgi:hypothetical protein